MNLNRSASFQNFLMIQRMRTDWQSMKVFDGVNTENMGLMRIIHVYNLDLVI